MKKDKNKRKRQYEVNVKDNAILIYEITTGVCSIE